MASSLRRNLLRAFAAPILCALLAGGWLAYRVAEHVTSTAYDQNLLNLASGVANRISVTDREISLAFPYEAEAVLRTDTIDRIYFRVRDAAGRVVAGDADLPPPASASAGAGPQFYEAIYHGEAIRAVRLHLVEGGDDYYVTVAETLGKRRYAVQELLLGFGLAVLLVLVAVGVVVRVGIPRGLAPLGRLERELMSRSGHDLAPIDLTGVPLEIREVVKALNALLDRLREANAAQRKFLQDAAHQLRTPLASLQVQLDLLDVEQDQPAAFKRLRLSVARVTRLANQLLALARAEAGERLMADAVPVNLAELIDDMIEDWLRVADDKQIDFGVQREPVTVTGDPTLLRELIANLVDNALKYTPSGGQVTLSCVTQPGRVALSVSDTGPGISAAAREQVFERFHRLPGTTATGSGLGLSIAKEIIAGHGGQIVIEAGRDGIGTTVTVHLPLVPERILNPL